MAFRDDRVALRERVAALEDALAADRRDKAELVRELEQARREIGRLGQGDDEAAALRAKNEKLQRRLEARGEKGPTWPWQAALITAGAISGVLVVVLLVGNDAAPVAAPFTVTPPVAAKPAPPALTADVVFPARVVRADGKALAPGDACEVIATVPRGPQSLAVSEVRIRCGSESLYTLTDPPGFGTTKLSVVAQEWPGPRAKSYRYALVLSDEGDRDGRPSAIVKTWGGPARVWRSGANAFRVDLEVEELSNARDGEGLNSDALGSPENVTYRDFVRRTGQVVETSDGARLSQGAACVFAIRPNWVHDGYDCSLLVRCGDEVLYGGGKGAFRACGAGPRRSPVDDGSVLDADLEKGVLRTETNVGLGRLRVTIALDPQGRSDAGVDDRPLRDASPR